MTYKSVASSVAAILFGTIIGIFAIFFVLGLPSFVIYLFIVLFNYLLGWI